MNILYRFVTSVLLCSLPLLLPMTANGHKLRIFAWSEGDIIYGETAFSGSRKPKNTEIVVQDALNQTVLLTTRTNDQGRFSFTIPERARQEQLDLLLIANAGEGHRGEWPLPAAEYLSVASPAEPVAGQTSTPTTARKSFAPPAEPASTAAVDEQLLRRIIDEELEKKLAPLKRMLAESSQKSPDLQDILGGIGYILGLAGLFAWLQARKQQKKE